MKNALACLGVVGLGCAAPSDNYEVAVHVNADAHVCIGSECGEARVWETFRLELAEGEYLVTADAHDPLERQEVALGVGPWGPNNAWVNFANGEFNFAKIEFNAHELATIFADDVLIGMAFPARSLEYGFTPRQYTFCAVTLDEARRDCASVDLADSAALIVFLDPH